MPAVSQQQQKIMGLALSVKRGDTPRSEVSDDVLNIVDSMSEKDLEKYTGTEHTGLPKTVEAKIREMVRELYKEMKSVNEEKVVTKKEWDRIHKDFKGMVNGKPHMMYLDPKTDKTVYGPVTIKESITEAKFNKGDLVKVIDRPKYVWDKQFWGKSGYIKGVMGKDILVTLPNGRTIVVDAKDIELNKD